MLSFVVTKKTKKKNSKSLFHLLKKLELSYKDFEKLVAYCKRKN